MNHSDFNALLRRCFGEREATYRNVRLPSDVGIRFGGDTNRATMFLSAAAVPANMQDDAAAFEGWSAVLIAWCGVRRVVIDWDEPADVGQGHYQRFLYRLGHFEALLGREIIEIAGRDRLTRCRVGNGAVATLNLAGTADTAEVPRGQGPKPTWKSAWLAPTRMSALV